QALSTVVSAAQTLGEMNLPLNVLFTVDADGSGVPMLVEKLPFVTNRTAASLTLVPSALGSHLSLSHSEIPGLRQVAGTD
ncbi:hypothetical protein KIPB_017145, partial [Kipferlia bialata]